MNKIVFVLMLGMGILAGRADAETRAFAIVLRDGPKKTAIVTDADILEYDFGKQALKVPATVLARIPRLPVAGKAFDVEVNGERIYSGLFVPIISSMSYKEPTIRVGGESPGTTISLFIRRPFYPEAIFNRSTDPRRDARIKKVIAALGKLREENASDADWDLAFTQNISNILMECGWIVPGKTRADLLKVFTAEGGLSTAKERTYVHRRCPYIKVDVKFNLSGTRQGVLDERPTDKISEISKPYLQWMIAD